MDYRPPRVWGLVGEKLYLKNLGGGVSCKAFTAYEMGG